LRRETGTPRASAEELDRVARLVDPSMHDGYSELALVRSLEEYLPRRREAVAPLTFIVDEQEHSTLFPALADRECAFEQLVIKRTGPNPPLTRWEFLRPFDTLTIFVDGSAETLVDTAPPLRVMARLILREQYVPMAKPREGGPTAGPRATVRSELFTPPAFAQYIRATGIVPFALALAVYYPDERIRYEVDLVDSTLLVDPRSHRFAPGRRVPRSARTGHAVDAIVARGELSLPSARALEAVVESNGLTAVEVAPLFGGVRELGTSALDSLVSRRLVVLDRRTGVYRPRLEALLGPGERGRLRAARAPLRGNPRLRTSVMELLAAAESRATCPLCGDPLAPGWKGMLCAKCQGLVGESGRPRSTA
jgi:hypothetical protein